MTTIAPTVAIPRATSCRAPSRGTRVETVTRPATTRRPARPKSCQSSCRKRRRSTRSTVRLARGPPRACPAARPAEVPERRPASSSWERRLGDLLQEDRLEHFPRDRRRDLAAEARSLGEHDDRHLRLLDRGEPREPRVIPIAPLALRVAPELVRLGGPGLAGDGDAGHPGLLAGALRDDRAE